LEEVRKAERVVYMPIIQKEESKEKEEQNEEELKEAEFEQRFKEFEKFLNELIFTQDNFVNGYVVTKPLAKKLFQYIEELVNMEGTPPEAKQLLREMEEHLAKYPLAERNFKNGIASIPSVVHREEILPRLTKIEKLLS
jgi:hypothetical protein